MSKPTKRKVPGDRSGGGRVTAKGTQPDASTRYTPPGPDLDAPSPTWVPVLMFALLGLGALMIIVNYLGGLPGAPTNWYLLGGLGMILGGIITATQYR